MDEKLKSEWVKALRSGEYNQATGILRNDTGAMCCIGVLATVVDASKWLEGAFENELNRKPCKFAYGDAATTAMLSDAQLKVLGLSIFAARELAEKNDGGHSFAQIADHIEKNL